MSIWEERKTLPVGGRQTEPLDIVATHILPLVTIYVCRWRGRGKMRVSACRPPSSRVFILHLKCPACLSATLFLFFTLNGFIPIIYA